MFITLVYINHNVRVHFKKYNPFQKGFQIHNSQNGCLAIHKENLIKMIKFNFYKF